MKAYSFRKDLLVAQENLFRLVCRLTVGREEAFGMRMNFKGWMHALMRVIFINNYRKITHRQVFADMPEIPYRLTMPQKSWHCG